MPWSIGRELAQTRELEENVRGLVSRFVDHELPKEVSEVKVTLGPDHDGEPAIFVDLFVRDDPNPSDEKVERYARFVANLRDLLLRKEPEQLARYNSGAFLVEPRLFPYVRILAAQ